MHSPDEQPGTAPRTASPASLQKPENRQKGEDLVGNQASASSKRKREEDPETLYAIHPEPGSTGLDQTRSEYAAGNTRPIHQDNDKPFSDPKRVRVNGHSPGQAVPARSSNGSTLPAELWHHVFRFVPPIFLGRLLRVNRAFHSYLTSDTIKPKPVDASSSMGVRPLDAESIWAASRRTYARPFPKPLRGLKELDMWRLLLGKACQLCGQTKDPAPMVGDANVWESGPGERTDIDLLLSSDFPSFLRLALPFALVSTSMNYIPKALVRESTMPTSLELVKRFYKPHLQQMRRRLVEVRELGSASADEWSKGLAEEGLERTNDAQRWEQWEAAGGLRKINKRPSAKAVVPLAKPAAMPNLPPKPPSIVEAEVLTPHHVPIDPRYNGQPPDVFALPAEQYQYPYSTAAAYQPPWVAPGQFQELPAQHHPPSIHVPRPERNMKTANEAKAARRAEIERRCYLLDPPLPANILKHMDSFQAAIQISTPFTDFAWDTLKPRLLAQRSSAEKRESELVQQNELLQSETRQRRHQEVPSKDTRDTTDRRWDRAQAPVHDLLGALADAYIDERWHGGRVVNKENSPKFAADVLLTVRQRFYERYPSPSGAAEHIPGHSAQNGSMNGSNPPLLFLENMKWVFDTKIKPFTEQFQRELFLCNGCDDNFKFYGFEGVIQHYAAKHTSSLSQGSIVVYWRAEWPDEPPFNPEPSLSKSAYYKVPSPATTSYSQIAQQLLGSDGRYDAMAESEPNQSTNGHSVYQNTTPHHSTQAMSYHDSTNQYSYNAGYGTPSSTAPVNGIQNGFVQTHPASHAQEWPVNGASTASAQSGGPITNGYSYAGAFNAPETIAVSSYGAQVSYRAPAPHPPHFDPSRNSIAQLTETYQQQMDEMAKQSRDVWFSTQGIKDLPASVRIYVVIHHMASRCSARFATVPSLAMFLDGLDNNAQMRPVRSLNGLACKTCVTQHNASHALDPQSQPPASDRKLFTLPHLLNHFRNAHLEGSEAFANPGSGPDAPRHDWTRDMIELPEDRLVSNLVYSPGMDDNKLDLIASAFPPIFPVPLPSLGSLRSSGVMRNPGPGSEVRRGKHDYMSGSTDHSIIVPPYSKGRVDDPPYDRSTSTFQPPSELSRPSEPPGEDEYDPHRPAYQGRPYAAGNVPGRNDILGALDLLGERPERHDRQDERPVDLITDLSKLLYGATQMQPSYDERRPPSYQGSQAIHADTRVESPKYYNPQRNVSTYPASRDKIAANGGAHGNGYATSPYASEQPDRETLRNRATSPSPNAGLRAAEQFLQRLNEAQDTGKTNESSSSEQRQRSVPQDQWAGQNGTRFVETERHYQHDTTSPTSYGPLRARLEVSPGPQRHDSSPTLQGDRDTSPSHVWPAGTYQYTNQQRSASNALVNIEDPELHRPGTRTYADRPISQGIRVQDRRHHNGYGTEWPQSGVDEFRHTQNSHPQDHIRYTTHDAHAPAYYRSRSPVEESSAQAVYRIRSPLPRQVQRIPYGHPIPERYEYVEDRDYAPDPQAQYQRHVEYVPVRMGEQRHADSGRYMVAQPLDHRARTDYVRVEDAFDQEMVYEQDGQLYRANPRTYRTPIIRNDEMASGYSFITILMGPSTAHGDPAPPRVHSRPVTNSAHQILPTDRDSDLSVDERNEGSSSSDEKEYTAEDDGYDEPAKSAIYDYASEKSLSHEESKLYYQRGRDIRQYDSGVYPGPARARTFSLNYGGRASQRYRRSGTVNNALPARETQRGIEESQTPPQQKTDRSADPIDHGRSTAIHGLDGGSSTHGGDNVPLPGQEPIAKDQSIHPELQEMSSMIQRVLDLRHKYIELSLQRPDDNPKDHPDWKVYPEPPKPVWTEDTTISTSPNMSTSKASSSMLFGAEQDTSQSRSQASLASVAEEPVHPRPVSPPKKQRKPGQDIGSDFDLSYFEPMPAEDTTMEFELDPGSVYQAYESAEPAENKKSLIKVPTLREYFMDLNIVKEVSEDGPIKSFAFRELQILDGKFNLHTLEKSYAEMMESKGVPHRDFYNVRKVDTHVHHSACMNSKHLLRFIKSKLKHAASDQVMFREGREMSLQDVFDSLGMTAYDLSIDTLDTHAHTDSFHRFDKFNLKYNPVGSSRLREIFLKTDNYIQGRYLAELTREVISDLEASKYQMVEWRVSIYGRNIDEWDKLASWVIDNKLVSHNVRWLIQIPRLYSLYKKQKIVDNFEQLIINIFQPLYEVTKNPSSHPKLHAFLDRVIGFDSVDDESKVERRFYRKFPTPKNWEAPENPMYNYWIYYLWANMTSLNHWRKRRGLGTFVLRPHCGEAGDVEHLQSAVLCCHSISHGLLLRKASLLQYIFYLDQIGIAMSPLSNNALFLAYDRNPFQVYFRRGLNVSLSTDDPLQFAYTKEPLIEEYSVAAQICKLSAADMCELAQHSVMQCGFEHGLKQRWLGPNYHLPGVQGNNVAKTNVPNLREEFRHNTLENEREMIARYAAAYTASKSSSASLYRDSQTASSSKGSKTTSRTSPVLPAQAARWNTNRSSVELRSLDTSNQSIMMAKRDQQGNANGFPESPTTGGHREPSIFPGIVRQRTRRKSLRQSSGSENDYEGSGLGLSRSGTLDPDGRGPSSVPEESDS
ncbi:MAG: hypothetical protein Q9168_005746 [Polycauliona sp. 1 TL-2023]